MTAGCLRVMVLAGAVCGPGLCLGQGVVEYGAATAAKGASVPAAKKLGDGLGAILKKAGSALDASQRGAVKEDSGRTVLPSSAAKAGSPTAKAQPVSEKEPSAEAFEKVTPGMTSEELQAALGKPSIRIVLPEDGRLVEICGYSAKGRELGSIRLVDGKVAEVQPARR